MRKNQREIKAFGEILKTLDKCQTIRLGLHDAEFPYIVPLSFGWECVDGKLAIYFHCAPEGKKVELLARNGKVCVEAGTLNGYARVGLSVTADYESVIAFGRAERVYGKTAVSGIELLLAHCGAANVSAKDCVLSNVVAVYKISIDSITGKKRFI